MLPNGTVDGEEEEEDAPQYDQRMNDQMMNEHLLMTGHRRMDGESRPSSSVASPNPSGPGVCSCGIFRGPSVCVCVCVCVCHDQH